MSEFRAIVILSCDRYSDLWNSVASNIKSKFSSVLYPIYLVSNEKTFEDDYIINLRTGFDLDWSTSVIKALNQIEETEVLILLDDMPFLDSVTFAELRKMFEILNSNHLGTLHPRPMPPKRHWHQMHDLWYEFTPDDSYTANVFGFWNKQVLLSVLQEGESAWDFEVYGSKRLNLIASSGALKSEAFTYLNLVIKGDWTREIESINRFLALDLDLSIRDIQKASSLKSKSKDIIFKLIIFHFPRFLQKRILEAFRRMSKR